MRKLIVLAVLMVALCAMPAFASVQNIKISGDVDSTYLLRNGFDLGSPGNADKLNDRIGDLVQSIFITQTRVRVDADLTDNVQAVVGLLNERAWNEDANADANVDVNLAYVRSEERRVGK